MQTSKDKQFQLQQLAQAKNTAAAKLFEEALNTERFPVDKLSNQWKQVSKIAITQSAPISHRLPLKEYAKVVACDPHDTLSLFQFGVLSNALETVSPDTLGLLDEDYENFITEAVEHIEWYQKRVKDLREEIQLKIDAEFKMKDASLNGNLKPIIGEA